jgi:ribonuclease HII
MDGADPMLVANAAEAAILLAAEGGADVVGALKIVLEFADDGAVTVTAGDSKPVTIAAAAIAAKADTDEDRESIPPPPPVKA